MDFVPYPVLVAVLRHCAFDASGTVRIICLIDHSGDGQTKFFYLDDVMLTGADIFKSGFEN